MVDNRFTRHQPYYRQEEMFAGLGVTIHRKTLCNWALLASDWLSSIYREIEYEHWRAGYRQFDETPIDYLQPGSGKAQTGTSGCLTYRAEACSSIGTTAGASPASTNSWARRPNSRIRK